MRAGGGAGAVPPDGVPVVVGVAFASDAAVVVDGAFASDGAAVVDDIVCMWRCVWCFGDVGVVT